MGKQLMRRSVGQGIRILLPSDVDPSTPVGEILGHPIDVVLIGTAFDSVQLAVQADDRLLVIEDELVRQARSKVG